MAGALLFERVAPEATVSGLLLLVMEIPLVSVPEQMVDVLA